MEAFAVVRETAYRVNNEKPFYVQILGGLAIHYGNIAEMRTGEGKTLTSTMPAYLNALTGDGVHIITVNEYLAGRDAAWMGNIYRFLGLTVGTNYRDMTSKEKKKHINAIFYIRLIMKLALTIYVTIWLLKQRIEFKDHLTSQSLMKLTLY